MLPCVAPTTAVCTSSSSDGASLLMERICWSRKTPMSTTHRNDTPSVLMNITEGAGPRSHPTPSSPPSLAAAATAWCWSGSTAWASPRWPTSLQGCTTALTVTVRCWEVGNCVLGCWGLLAVSSACSNWHRRRERLFNVNQKWQVIWCIKTDWTQAPSLRKPENNKIRWVRYSPAMSKSHWKRAIQIPTLINSKIPAGISLIPSCDSATQESASALMLVQHLCHHCHHRADSSFPCGRESNWRSSWFVRIQYLKSYMNKTHFQSICH